MHLLIRADRRGDDDGRIAQLAHVGPPLPPMNPVVFRPRSRASRSAASTFGLRPEVDRPTATSPRRRAWQSGG
jgi:hypothetical protein